MKRHAWAATIGSIDARAFDVADDVWGFIRIDMPASLIVASRMPKPHRYHRTITGSRDRIDAAPRVDQASRRQQDARRIVGINKLSTSSNKKDATLKVKQDKAGQAQGPDRGIAGQHALLASLAAGWRSHLASTTMDSRVR